MILGFVFKRRKELAKNWWILMALFPFAPIVILLATVEEYKKEWEESDNGK